MIFSKKYLSFNKLIIPQIALFNLFIANLDFKTAKLDIFVDFKILSEYNYQYIIFYTLIRGISMLNIYITLGYFIDEILQIVYGMKLFPYRTDDVKKNTIQLFIVRTIVKILLLPISKYFIIKAPTILSRPQKVRPKN